MNDAGVECEYRVVKLNPGDTEKVISSAATVLRGGGVVLVPTDTVYGLVCLPGWATAVERVFIMKQRPLDRRLPIIVADLEQAERELPINVTTVARLLAHAFWPGPLTIAFGLRHTAGGWLAGRHEAAVRAPSHPILCSLARSLGPLLMTSANRHGDSTPLTIEEAISSLVIPPALAIDGGILAGAPSTLVNVNLDVPTVERFGVIGLEEIRRVINDV